MHEIYIFLCNYSGSSNMCMNLYKIIETYAFKYVYVPL